MSQERRYFSEFTIAEQRIGLDLENKRETYFNDKATATKAIDDATKRLTARQYFDEFEMLNQNDSFRDRFSIAKDLYFRKQQQALEAAQKQLAQLNREFESVTPQLETNAEILQAILFYQKTYKTKPTIQEDMPAPNQLSSGIYDFEEIVKKELSSTRTLLAQHKPELLQQYDFRVAEECILDGGAGLKVVHVADELRAARDTLAKLRAQAPQNQTTT